MTNVGVCVKCKDELNVIEFMEHYYSLGFCYIFFVDDKSNPSVQSIIGERFKGKYKIVINEKWLQPVSLISTFTKHINDNFSEISSRVDYLLNVDMDEYLVLKNPIFKNKIQNVISYYEPFDLLKINWVMFGNNNLKYGDCTTLKDKFTMSDNISSMGIKSLVKLNSYNKNGRITSHLFDLKKNSIIKNCLNNITDNKQNENKTRGIQIMKLDLYIAHYISQTIEHFINRRYICHNKCKITDSLLPLLNNITVKEIQEIIKNNKTNLIDYLHNNNVKLNEELKKIEIGIKKHIKPFFNSINRNRIDNYDLVENKK